MNCRSLLVSSWRRTSTIARVVRAVPGDLVETTLVVDDGRALNDDVVPALHVSWIAEEVHRAAMAALLIGQRRDLSLIECVSFETMRRLGIDRAFAFEDQDPRRPTGSHREKTILVARTGVLGCVHSHASARIGSARRHGIGPWRIRQ